MIVNPTSLSPPSPFPPSPAPALFAAYVTPYVGGLLVAVAPLLQINSQPGG